MPLDSNSRTYASARLGRPSSMDVRTRWYAVVLSGRTLRCFIISNSLQGGRVVSSKGFVQQHCRLSIDRWSSCCLGASCASASFGSTAGAQAAGEGRCSACFCLTVQTQETTCHNLQCTGNAGWQRQFHKVQTRACGGKVTLSSGQAQEAQLAEMEVL